MLALLGAGAFSLRELAAVVKSAQLPLWLPYALAFSAFYVSGLAALVFLLKALAVQATPRITMDKDMIRFYEEHRYIDVLRSMAVL